MKVAGFLNGRANRALLLAATAVILTTFVEPPPAPPAGPPARASVTAVPVALDRDHPARRRVSELVFLRGWDLDSPDDRFGAISALHVDDGRVTAVNDAGVVLRFPLPTRAGTVPLTVQPLPDLAAADKRSRDSEALVVRGEQAWIAFERRNAISRFRTSDWSSTATAKPRAMRGWRTNAGPEAMVRLANGRFLIFAEGRDDDAPFSPVALFEGDPAEAATPSATLRYRRQPGFRVTDAALLPDGRLLILNRRASLTRGVAARLVVAQPPQPGARSTIEGRVIAELAPPLTVDNMEALSVAREGDRTIVRIASDDNFMRLQRTLLLEFAWDEPAR